MGAHADADPGLERHLAGRRVMLTGQRGFIGSTLRPALEAHGCAVSVQDGDITQPGAWSAVDADFDFVVHLAAVENQPSFERELSVNALSVIELARHIASLKRKPTIIFASSTNVWGDATGAVVDETTADAPASIWSTHKLLAEHYLRVFLEQGVPSVILRLPNVMGCCGDPAMMSRSALNRAIETCVRNRTLTVYQNKQCIRDYVDVSDITTTFLHSLRSAPEMSRHAKVIIGSGTCMRIIDVWREIARVHAELTGVKVEIEENSSQLNAFAMRSSAPSNALAIRLLGYAPRVSVAESIRRTMQYFLAT